MRRADRRTIDEVGLPGPVLMENAGAAVARLVEERFPQARRVVVLCGRGNNGGDGFVVARRLGGRARAFLLGAREGVAGDARTHLLACERSGGRVSVVPDAAGWAAALRQVEDADVIVDAVLGTGLRSEPTGLARDAIGAISGRYEAGVPVVAVDLPSGVPSDGGALDWPAALATVTVTFAAPKRGHVLPPACHHVGELVVADIGISPESLAAVGPLALPGRGPGRGGGVPPAPPGRAQGRLRARARRGGVAREDRGRGAGRGGRAARGGRARDRGDARAVPPRGRGGARGGHDRAAAGHSPGGLDEAALPRLLDLAGERDAVVLGPGLGQEPGTRALVRAFVRACPVPLVIDADGLNALAALAGEPSALDALRRDAATVLTPHPGEMARLAGRPTADVQRSRPETATALARETGALVVLKGERTLVAEPSGRAAVAAAGNPGMATGGTGDVLAGVVGSLLARHGALLSATAAVVVHGRAGDLAARERGEEGLTAGDVVEALPAAIDSVRRAGGGGPSAS